MSEKGKDRGSALGVPGLSLALSVWTEQARGAPSSSPQPWDPLSRPQTATSQRRFPLFPPRSPGSPGPPYLSLGSCSSQGAPEPPEHEGGDTQGAREAATAWRRPDLGPSGPAALGSTRSPAAPQLCGFLGNRVLAEQVKRMEKMGDT